MKNLSLPQVLEDFFNYKTSTLYTAIPCRVVTVKSSLEDQRVDVQPLPKNRLRDGTTKDSATIPNVPVIFPSSSKSSITFPVDVGDTVLCVFSQKSLDSFKASNSAETYSPVDSRRFDIRDAIAIPGLFPFSQSPNNPSKHKFTHSTRDLVMVHNLGSANECEVRLKESGDIELRTDQDFYATFNDGVIECNNLTVTCQGDFSLACANLDVTVTGTTTVVAPTTSWTGAFSLTGPLTVAGALAMTGGGSDTATINAPLQINDSVTVTGGDVVADGISLKTHTHNENGSGGGVTDPPN